MTLTTSILAYRPVPIEPLFRFCQELLGNPEEMTVERHARGDLYKWSKSMTYDNHVIQNEAGQGLDAILSIRYGADGPLDEEDLPGTPVIRISFDTGYSWMSENARGLIDLDGPDNCAQANDLHAYLVTQVAEYLTEKRSPYAWHCDPIDAWYDSLDEIEMLGDAWKIEGRV